MGPGTRRSYRLRSHRFICKMNKHKKAEKGKKKRQRRVPMMDAGWRERHILSYRLTLII